VCKETESRLLNNLTIKLEIIPDHLYEPSAVTGSLTVGEAEEERRCEDREPRSYCSRYPWERLLLRPPEAGSTCQHLGCSSVKPTVDLELMNEFVLL
jgi:hypothetical protein